MRVVAKHAKLVVLEPRGCVIGTHVQCLCYKFRDELRTNSNRVADLIHSSPFLFCIAFVILLHLFHSISSRHSIWKSQTYFYQFGLFFQRYATNQRFWNIRDRKNLDNSTDDGKFRRSFPLGRVENNTTMTSARKTYFRKSWSIKEFEIAFNP